MNITAAKVENDDDNEKDDDDDDDEEEPIYESAEFAVDVFKVGSTNSYCVQFEKVQGSGFCFYDTMNYLRENLLCNNCADPTL